MSDFDWNRVLDADKDVVFVSTVNREWHDKADQIFREQIHFPCPMDMGWIKPLTWTHVFMIHRMQRALVAHG